MVTGGVGLATGADMAATGEKIGGGGGVWCPAIPHRHLFPPPPPSLPPHSPVSSRFSPLPPHRSLPPP